MSNVLPFLRRYGSLIMTILVTVLLVGYLGIMIMRGADAFAIGGPAGIGLGVGVFCLVIAGGWAVWATINSGLIGQRLSALAQVGGFELDGSGLERMPSGRYVREDADRLFEVIAAEWTANPDDWRTNYRLARAYDFAGDRARARQMMKMAAQLEEEQRQASS